MDIAVIWPHISRNTGTHPAGTENINPASYNHIRQTSPLEIRVWTSPYSEAAWLYPAVPVEEVFRTNSLESHQRIRCHL